MTEYSNKELLDMIKCLHKDNERDTVAGLRENEAEFIVMKRIHQRNNMIHMLLNKVKL